jgi:hypothetical protein
MIRILFSCVLAAASAVGPAPAGPALLDEEEAAAELARADEEIAKSRHERARRRLEKLSQRFPDTEAGREAFERLEPNGVMGWVDLVVSGPDENRVQIAVMGDGYVLDKQSVFDDIAADVPPVFERDEVFGEYFSYLNFVRANVVSVEDGIDGHGRQANTALDARVISGPSSDHVGVDVGAVKSVLRRIRHPRAYAIVFVPRGSLGTGGGGVATIGGRDVKVLVHEWGHAFATLRDEIASDSGYRGDATSWINVSDTEDPARVPWAHWLEARARGIGVYQGADGRERGAWRPTASGCRMENGETFCVVCREALVLEVYRNVDPIDAAVVTTSPETAPEDELEGSEPHELEVTVLQPASHDLEVRWWVLPADAAPRPSGDYDVRPRGRRGPLEPIGAKETRKTRSRNGVHRFTVDPAKLAPGRYRVLVRVRDTTEIRGEKLPWVLKDTDDLLLSERGWWLEVAE